MFHTIGEYRVYHVLPQMYHVCAALQNIGHAVVDSDANGKRHGEYRRYDSLGKLCIIGFYNHGVDVGVTMEWMHTGNLCRIIEWNSDCIHATRTFYYTDGAIESREEVLKSMLNNCPRLVAHGQRIQWHENGQMRSRISMYKNMPEGEWLLWRPDGTLCEHSLLSYLLRKDDPHFTNRRKRMLLLLLCKMRRARHKRLIAQYGCYLKDFLYTDEIDVSCSYL